MMFDTIQEAMKSHVGARNDSGYSVEEWAHRLSHAPSTMYAKGGAVPFTLEDLVNITAHGFLRPLRFLADVGKCVAIPLPGPNSGDPVNVQAAEAIIRLGRSLKALAESQGPDSLGGAAIVPAEARQIKSETILAVEAASAIIEAMDRIIKQEKD